MLMLRRLVSYWRWLTPPKYAQDWYCIGDAADGALTVSHYGEDEPHNRFWRMDGRHDGRLSTSVSSSRSGVVLWYSLGASWAWGNVVGVAAKDIGDYVTCCIECCGVISPLLCSATKDQSELCCHDCRNKNTLIYSHSWSRLRLLLPTRVTLQTCNEL